ncbi:MAG: 50S ribosomal protein L28 [Candidatus Omnitrophota bacterium]|nr:MAG: 50S ribosomal protein L28 [Candidatus Omnitrophota bacterium]RKY42005.1 MAG: 50S ribosomal protein L28 [Candidatus Omnitrophota bacterium]
MSKQCFFCGKKSATGSSIQRRGLAKKKGGVGKKITGITKRKFKPNLQRVKVQINGRIKRVLACTKCIKKGRVKKPLLSKPI